MTNSKNSGHIFIIAEAGVNHDGNIDQAIQLIDIATQAGADAVKFQTFKTEAMVTKTAQMAEYQVTSPKKLNSQFELLKNLELSWNDHLTLFDYAKKNHIEFLSSPFDIESINLLEKLNINTYKIPSGEILSIPYLRALAKLNKKTILSTGMSDINEIHTAIKCLTNAGLELNNLTLLHTNTAYPTPYEDVNLNAMLTLKELFSVDVGFSDHSLGIEVPIAAAALGASVIEKHFTLDKLLPGPDHQASLSPQELKMMISAVRNIEIALGSEEKKISPSESKNITAARKSIVAKQDIKIGELFTEDNLTIKRPGNGLSSLLWDKVVGTKAKQNFLTDTPIRL